MVSDARGYADEIAALFRDAGWNVKVDNAIITGPDIKGVWITIRNPQAPPVGTVTLQQASKAGGLSIPIKVDTTMPDELWLSVSSK